MPAKSPIANTDKAKNVTILAGGSPIKDKYVVQSIEVIHEVNRLSRAVICIADGEPGEQDFAVSSSGDFLPGKEITIKAGYGDKLVVLFVGIVVQHGIRSSGGRQPSALVLKCRHKASGLTIGRRNRTFDNSKDSDAIKKIFKEHSIQVKMDATATAHPKLVQYGSTDWDFVLSRIEANGHIMLTAPDGKLSIGKPKASGTPVLRIAYGESLLAIDAHLDATGPVKQFSAMAWDPKKHQKVSVTSKTPTVNAHGNVTPAKLSGILKIKNPELFTSGPLLKADLQNWADGAASRAHLSWLRGQVTFPGATEPKTGAMIELAGVGDRFNGKAYITKVVQTIRFESWSTTVHFGLPSHTATEAQAPLHMPAAGGLLPGVGGLHLGLVKQIHEDPDGGTRILVNLPLFEAQGKGFWARMANLYASNQAGFFFMPEIGDEVLVGFLNDDPRFPVVLGSLFSSKLKPPYTPDKKNNIKALVTKSKLKMEFEDEKKIITIATPAGNIITIDDNGKKITIVDQNKNQLVLDNKGITLDSGNNVKITAKGQITLEAKAGIKGTTSSGIVNFEGDIVKVKGKTIVNIEGAQVVAKGSAAATLEGGGMLTIKGGIVRIN